MPLTTESGVAEPAKFLRRMHQNALLGLNGEDEMTTNSSPEHILEVGLGFWASKTLLSAVEMEVFSELAKQAEDLETLRSRLGIHPRSARDFFDALVALGFLSRVEGKYANSPATDLYLDKHKPTYIGGILQMANHRLYGYWNHLTEALRTGKHQNEAKDGRRIAVCGAVC